MGGRVCVFLAVINLTALVHSASAAPCVPITKYLKENAEPTRVLPAAEPVFRRRSADGQTLQLEAIDSDKFEKEWVANLPSRVEREITLGTPAVNMGGDKGGPTSVQKVIVDGRPMVFRPLLSEEENYLAFMLPSKLRRTLASASLNRLLGLETDAGARVVKIGNHLGVLSEFAEGKPLRFPFEADQIPRNQLAMHMVFEFLVGNRDDLVQNFILDGRGILKSVDHDLAFSDNIPTYRPKMPIGNSLPPFYPAELMGRLRSLKPYELTRALSQDLMPHEVEAIQLRLEIILEDMKPLP